VIVGKRKGRSIERNKEEEYPALKV